MSFRIRHLSPWEIPHIILDDLHFSAAFTAEEANALLCNWQPVEELLLFPGPKAWFCVEASSYEPFYSPEMLQFREKLAPWEFLYHAHPDPKYRVPHPTHISTTEGLNVRRTGERIDRAVAIVSNVTGSQSAGNAESSLRVRYITNPLVDLFGRRASWEAFQLDGAATPGVPDNYKGEIAGYWTADLRLNYMARYRVSVCMENTMEPYYFTEKFVGAVQAGCIPVYHAEPTTVRTGILRGARWVDPADFDFDATATIAHALNEDLEEYWEANSEWLKSDFLLTTSSDAVFRRIGHILQGTSGET